MADSDSVETRQLLRAQTKLMMALRQNQNAMIQEQKAIRVVLENQAEALGELILSLNSVQGRVSSLTKDLVGLKGEVAKTNKHLGRMDQRQDRMDKNLLAIMRHLGVEGTEEQ